MLFMTAGDAIKYNGKNIFFMKLQKFGKVWNLLSATIFKLQLTEEQQRKKKNIKYLSF